ncbi:MAG: Hsp20/alpha crystallin family protein [Candidatus Theseobacter exili]|nr:Hsp20/alpha crystallin family protein [Candidatus Theseobacter exili]
MFEEKKKVQVKEPEERGIQPMYSGDIFQAFENVLEDFRRDYMRPWRSRRLWGRPWGIEPLMKIREPYMDFVDKEEEYQINAEIPGIPKDKIDITVTKNSIEISAKIEVEKKDEEKGYIVKERSYSEIYRKQSFPEEVIPEKAEATVKNGVLEIKIPKKTPTPESKKHKLEIK